MGKFNLPPGPLPPLLLLSGPEEQQQWPGRKLNPSLPVPLQQTVWAVLSNVPGMVGSEDWGLGGDSKGQGVTQNESQGVKFLFFNPSGPFWTEAQLLQTRANTDAEQHLYGSQCNITRLLYQPLSTQEVELFQAMAYHK